VTPYYEHGGITIYHGDCREIEIFASVLLTDPPYGICADERQANRANKQPGRSLAPSRSYGDVTHWDAEPFDSVFLLAMLGRVSEAIIWGGNYFDLPPESGWLVWDKQTGNNGYADAELAWTNLGGAVRTFRHRWMGMLRAPSDDGDARVHPTQKPVPLMRWCLERCGNGLVLDPLMGSGSTLVAAKDLGRRAIGIEIEERYCEIAAQRLEQEVLAL
jgi:DNA modification methylase